MAPIRRYLRITKYSVLECRIYLDNPGLAQSWLLNPRDPVLPRVIESIRPLVLPKLREERERGKKKSSKKKAIKDVVVKDDFEVSMFLTDTSTRHSLLYKHKHFREKMPGRMQSNSTKLIGETSGVPVDLEADDSLAVPVLREEDSDEDNVRLADIPAAQPSKRQRNASGDAQDGDAAGEHTDSPFEIGSDDAAPPTKRIRAVTDDDDDDADDKKKLAMDISYEGFAIYGRVLCLLVRKRESNSQPARRGGGKPATTNKLDGQASMEGWITSTQVPVGEDMS